jgi:hypothetical protein
MLGESAQLCCVHEYDWCCFRTETLGYVSLVWIVGDFIEGIKLGPFYYLRGDPLVKVFMMGNKGSLSTAIVEFVFGG